MFAKGMMKPTLLYYNLQFSLDLVLEMEIQHDSIPIGKQYIKPTVVELTV